MWMSIEKPTLSKISQVEKKYYVVIHCIESKHAEFIEREGQMVVSREPTVIGRRIIREM